MIVLYVLAGIFAIFFQAFFTSAEMALTSVNKIRLKKLMDAGDQRAVKINEFLSGMGAFLGTTLVGTNICTIVSSSLITRVFSEYVGIEYSSLVATVVVVPTILVVAEIIPKIIARYYATPFALYLVGFLANFQRLFKPLVLFVNFCSKIILMPFQKPIATWDVAFTKGDLKSLMISSHEAGEVDHDELKLMHKVLDFGGKPVESCMVPMYRVSLASADETIDNLKKVVALTGFTRIPVYSGARDNITGIVNIYDVLFSAKPGVDARKVAEFARKAVTVKHSKSLDAALADLKREKQSMGIVTDKDNKPAGIITIEDILEQLVGNIEDKT